MHTIKISKADLIALINMREACAAAMRVLIRHELADECGTELDEANVPNGFWVAFTALMRRCAPPGWTSRKEKGATP